MKIGTLIGFEKLVPDVKRRSEITGIFKDGRVLHKVPAETLLDPSEIPSELSFNRKSGSVSDLFSSEGGVMIASSAMHDLLQSLDPATHQFIPIRIKGKTDFGDRYVLNVHYVQDTIVDELSNVRTNAQSPSPSLMYINFSPRNFKVVVDNSKRSHANMWRERRYTGSLLISDELSVEIKRRDLKIFPQWQALEIYAELR